MIFIVLTQPNSSNQLTRIGEITCKYDALNNLIAQDGRHVNHNSALSKILKAQNGSDIRHYIYGTGLLYEEKSDGSIITYHFDHLGNTVALSDESGTIISRREYTPYGSTSHHTGTQDTPFWYGGRFGVLTANNGLMSMRARWYNPYLRRFVSQDPIGFEGGLNWFAYANGNPVNMLDPFGLEAVLQEAIDLAYEGRDLAMDVAQQGVSPNQVGAEQTGNPYTGHSNPYINDFEHSVDETVIAIGAHTLGQAANAVDSLFLDQPGNFWNYWGMVEVWRHQRLINHLEQQTE